MARPPLLSFLYYVDRVYIYTVCFCGFAAVLCLKQACRPVNSNAGGSDGACIPAAPVSLGLRALAGPAMPALRGHGTCAGRPAAPRVGKAGEEAAEREGPRGADVAHAGGHIHQTRLYSRWLEWGVRWAAWGLSFHPGSLSHHVHVQTMDHPAVCGLQHRRGK